jgi:FemAB family protein
MTDSYEIERLLELSGLESLPLRGHEELWDATLGRAAFVPVDYLRSMLKYQLAYLRSHGDDWRDQSMLLCKGGKVIGVWPLSVRPADRALTSSGAPIFNPLFASDVTSNVVKTTISAVHRFAQAWTLETSARSYRGQEHFVGVVGESVWLQSALSDGAKLSVSHDFFLDMTLGLEGIRSQIRKSYKPLISSGEKHWVVGVDVLGDAELWAEFQALHAAAAGRQTRSKESWECQRQAVASGQGFLVYLRSTSGEMVGAGYFQHSRDEGLYSVGAYDRGLFDKPLGHVVQYHAIKMMLERGIRWYRIGAVAYPADSPAPSAKELSISHFKQGFSSHIMLRLIFEKNFSGTRIEDS